MTRGALPETLPDAQPWQLLKRSIAWLLFLGPFFFISYGFANWWAETQSHARTLVFDWESSIPFVGWSIVPYWSIDLLYGLSFLLCRSRREVDCHARRLFSAQIIAISCFIVFPLRFSFEKPPLTDSAYQTLYTALAGFDKPFNQAPSLHIALLIILWVRYVTIGSNALRHLVNLWAILIFVSVLTTYQHHFIDIPTGALLGLFCLWLWPDEGPSPLARWRISASPERRRLGARYVLGASLCAAFALYGEAQGWRLWLLWPAISLLLVALIYFGFGPEGFQKREGRLGIATCWILAPYIAIAWLNSRIWTFRHPKPDEIVDGMWLGRMPTRKGMRAGHFESLLDLTAELSAPSGNWTIYNLPWLDLVTPDVTQLRLAANQIEALHSKGPLLVCCALGFSRSASAVAAWLLLSKRACSVDAAIAMVAAHQPQLVLGRTHRAMLADFHQALPELP